MSLHRVDTTAERVRRRRAGLVAGLLVWACFSGVLIGILLAAGLFILYPLALTPISYALA
jgi:hypothetical protein